VVDTWTLRSALTELTRAGCRVERIAHAGGVVVFADPAGGRWFLAIGRDGCRLAREGAAGPAPVHESVAGAIRAVGLVAV
jgi:hypothetical protein